MINYDENSCDVKIDLFNTIYFGFVSAWCFSIFLAVLEYLTHGASTVFYSYLFLMMAQLMISSIETGTKFTNCKFTIKDNSRFVKSNIHKYVFFFLINILVYLIITNNLRFSLVIYGISVLFLFRKHPFLYPMFLGYNLYTAEDLYIITNLSEEEFMERTRDEKDINGLMLSTNCLLMK